MKFIDQVVIRVLLVIGLVGWVFNIIKLVRDASMVTDLTIMMSIRGIGIIFPPLGAVLGFM